MTKAFTNNEIKICKVSLSSARLSSTLYHEWLWSIKKNKWIRSHCHTGARWGCDYYVLPGHYIVFSLTGYLDNRGAELRIIKIRIDSDCRRHDVETLFSITLPLKVFDEIIMQLSDDNPIKDFVNGRPIYYHTVSDDAPSDKKYSKTLQEYINEFKNTVLKHVEE